MNIVDTHMVGVVVVITVNKEMHIVTAGRQRPSLLFTVLPITVAS